MSVEFNCPQCGQMVEADESACGQVAACPHCGKGIVVPRGNPKLHIIRTRPASNGAEQLSPISDPMQQRKKGYGTTHDRIPIPQRLERPPQENGDSSAVKKRGGVLRKIVTIFCVVIGTLIVIGLASYGGYQYFGDIPRLERGIAHYEKKAYTKAIKLLIPLAKKGNVKAQLYIGDCYANGNGVIMDTEEAVKWYHAAANQELPEAQHRMFVSCRDGVGMEKNLANAAKWCRKAAEAGFAEAMFDMGMLYVKGEGVEQNDKSAFKWFRKGGERGHAMCLYQFGQCYKLGFGVGKDEDEAQKWQNKAVSSWRTSAATGNTRAMVQLAELYEKGDVVEFDKEEAVRWYRRAAEAGDVHAQFRLSICYRDGRGIEEDREEAAKWMLKAAEQGTDKFSQWAMGRFYEEGTGVEKNMNEAVKWFERAAKKGLSMAKYSLAMCYLRGEGIQQDEARAEELLVEAAGSGNKEAQRELDKIRGERAEKQRIAERTMAEKKKMEARVKADKQRRIREMKEIEEVVVERVTRINAILRGKQGGEWRGFDASKIVQTDPSLNVKEEGDSKNVSGMFSEADSIEKMDEAISSMKAELERLEVRLAEITRVKKVYDEKELESRKEKCLPCDGTGRIKCKRCNGSGSLVVMGSRPCTRCGGGENDFSSAFGSDGGMNCGKGQIKIEVECSNCRGTGQVRTRCQSCGGRGKIKLPDVSFRLSKPYETCSSCNGSGRGYPETCPKCSGMKKVEKMVACPMCHGKGEVAKGTNETCPVCKGKGDIKCEHCGGRGFTYRSKESQ